LPKYELSVLSAKRAPRSWYADGIADIGLSILIFLPLGMGNDVLIPGQIIDIARKLNGYVLS
jgi:hypothetical protein